MTDDSLYRVDIGHRWLTRRPGCEPEWTARCLDLIGRRPLAPMIDGASVDGPQALVAAALTLLPLECWDGSLAHLVHAAGFKEFERAPLLFSDLAAEAEANGWHDWSGILKSEKLANSGFLALWCLDFVWRLRPPGLEQEAAAIITAWIGLDDATPPGPETILAIAIAGESTLEGTDQIRIDERIFLAISEKKPCSEWSVETLMKVVPSGLLDQDLRFGGLPKRVITVTDRLGAVRWRDLLMYEKDRLREFNGMGGTSVAAIRNAIRPAVLAMISDREGQNRPILKRISEWLCTLSNQDERAAAILTSRLGLNPGDEHIPTLEDLGSRLAVTRERIRQIESKTWKMLSFAIPSVTQAGFALAARVAENKGLLPITDISCDPRWADLVAKPSSFSAMVSFGWIPEVRLWDHDGRLYLSLLDETQLSALIRGLRESFSDSTRDIDVVEWCREHGVKCGIDLDRLVSHAVEAFNLDAAKPILIAKRNNRRRSDIFNILDASPVPMHFRDVAALIDPNATEPEKINSGLIALTPGVMLMGFGYYGTIRHFPEMDTSIPAR